MPWSGATYTHKWDWEREAPRNTNEYNARLEDELNDIASAVTELKTQIDAISGGGGGGGGGSDTFRYRYSTDLTPPPASGRFEYNNATRSSVTQVVLHDQTDAGNDIRNYLGFIQPNDKLYIQDDADSTSYDVFIITAVTQPAGYTQLTVTWDHSGPVPLVANNTVCILSVIRVDEAATDPE